MRTRVTYECGHKVTFASNPPQPYHTIYCFRCDAYVTVSKRTRKPVQLPDDIAHRINTAKRVKVDENNAEIFAEKLADIRRQQGR